MSSFPCPLPKCGATESEVLDTRHRPNKIWRRRECSAGHRFTTFESVRTPDDYTAVPTDTDLHLVPAP